MSRQAYYQARHRQRVRRQRDEQVIALVRAKRLHQPRLGTRKLHHLLASALACAGLKLGRDALFDLLRQSRMLVTARRAYHKTTDSHHRFRRHPNLLKVAHEQMQASEQVWVADITYLPTHHGFVYLSLVTDAYSRKIVGYHVHDSIVRMTISSCIERTG
jgi:putative transposase